MEENSSSAPNQLLRVALSLFIIALSIFIAERLYAFGHTLSGILSTLVGAFLIAVLARPFIIFLGRGVLPMFIIHWIEHRFGRARASRALKWRLPYSAAVSITYLFIGLIVSGAVTILAAAIIPQAADFFNRFPEIAASFPAQMQNVINSVLGFLRISAADIPQIATPQELSTQLRQIAGVVAAQSVTIAAGAANFMGQFFFAFILSVYMSMEGRDLRKQFFAVLPAQAHEGVAAFAAATGKAISGYLSSTFISALILAFTTAIVFSGFGVPFGVVVGLVYGLLSFIPLIGSPIGVLIAIIVTLFFNAGAALPIAIILFVINALVGYVILPRLLSTSVGVPSLLALLAVSVGTQIFGFWGLIFSVPIMGAIYATVFDFYLPRRQLKIKK
ncbi:MAG TPA: AI-2E family transporter [Thermoflexales bacterium]|nr:AI-2E family transporter [Thermoflexales bacterium]HQW34639.1 AI-2E family transporter [Thermoflexales bacterium]HQZ23130.1 AI-2E family transporter [Thermoflexales bacterium]